MLITEEPPEDTDSKRAYKYPLIASHFFAGDINSVLDYLFEDEELLQSLFGFITNNEKLNYLLAGYFRKAFEGLVGRNQHSILKFIFDNDYQTAFLQHIYSQSIADILLKCLTGAEDYLDKRGDIIDKLISKIVDNNPIQSINSEYILSKLMTEKSTVGYAQLMSRLTLNLEKIVLGLENKDKFIARSCAKIIKNILSCK